MCMKYIIGNWYIRSSHAGCAVDRNIHLYELCLGIQRDFLRDSQELEALSCRHLQINDLTLVADITDLSHVVVFQNDYGKHIHEWPLPRRPDLKSLERTTLVQGVAWCRQAPGTKPLPESSLCWPRSMSQYGGSDLASTYENRMRTHADVNILLTRKTHPLANSLRVGVNALWYYFNEI